MELFVRIIIAGDGKMGSTLARQLSAEGYDLTLIDRNLRVLEENQEKYDVMVVQGNCAAMDVLLQAGVKEADLLIAMADADEVNLLSCMTAKGLNPKIHTIARVRTPEYADQIYNMSDLFGLSLAVNPEKQTAMEIERLLKYPGFLKRDTFAKGRVEIVELRVEEGGKFCNVALNDMNNVVKCKILVCAVLRGGKAITPRGDFVLKAGDRLFVTASTASLTHLLHNLGVVTHKVKRLMICGGGRVSVYLAKQLAGSGVSIQIIERNHDRCLQLATMLPDVDIIEGDASNEFLLESEGISECDALLTATGLDELNMVVSLFGASCGVCQVITKLGRISNSKILDSLTLGSVISPKEVCSNAIVRYVRAMKDQAGAALTVHSIADGQAEAIEFLVDSKTLHCGEKLRNLKLKPNMLIVGITRGGKTQIPDGDSSFDIGDTVIVVTSNENVVYNINDIFKS